ncbi:MAG TPA: hypothetical protein GXX75_12100 [Clostridiales bacterium]|nr:hypothetical protein [Clostridiales bacterium]
MEARKSVVLVFDVGSSGMKGFLYNKNGICIGKSQYLYSMKIDGQAATQKAEDFENGVQNNSRNLLKYAKEAGCSIEAIVFTSQRSSLVCLSEKGHVLTDFIMWYDKRSQDICNTRKETLKDSHYQICGIDPSPILLAPKITWVKENMKDVAKKTVKYVSIQDFLIYRATGKFVTDPTLACRTGLMEIHTMYWSEEMLDCYGIHKKELCDIIPTGSIAGKVTREFSGMTGLPEGIPVITAGGDQQCSVHGQGIDESAIGVTLGSGGYAVGISSTLALAAEDKIDVCASSVSGWWNLEKSIPSVGTSYDWCRRNFYGEECIQEEFNKKLELSEPGAGGVIAYTDFTKRDKSGGSKALMNIGLSTSREDMARAFVESVVDDMAESCLLLKKRLVKINKVLVTGGMSKSDLINQMLADMLDIPVIKNRIDEATADGAWLLAAKELGMYSVGIENDRRKALQEKEYIPNKFCVERYAVNRLERRKIFEKESM